jgi:transcriptional repressor NrdR
LRIGVERACWKRPVSGKQIAELVTRVEQAVYSTYDNEIPSEELGRIVMSELFHLDEVAYIRFASVYREFRDASDFVDELQPMLRKSK